MTQAPSQVPAKASPKNDLKALLQSDRVRQEIAEVAPKYMDPERMLKVALAMVMTTPKLQQCSQISLLSALIKCSTVGLEPDGYHAYLIPFGDQVQVIFGYHGLVYIAKQFGIGQVDTQSICENDTIGWKRSGTSVLFTHEIDWKKPRGPEVSYYCVWQDEGIDRVEVMTLPEIEKVRATSKAANNGPWVSAYGQMCKKTAIRRAAGHWPRQGAILKAFYGDDDTVGDKFTPKSPEFSKPVRNSSMDFLEAPAGSLSNAPLQPGIVSGAPLDTDDEKDLAEAGLAPDMIEHDDFERWLFSRGILYAQLKELAVTEKLYEYADTFESLRDLPLAVIKRLEKMRDGIVAGVKGVKA